MAEWDERPLRPERVEGVSTQWRPDWRDKRAKANAAGRNGTLAWPDCAGKKITTSSSSSSSSFPSTIRILQLKRSLLENPPVNCFICCKGAQSAAFHDPSPVAAPVTSPVSNDSNDSNDDDNGDNSGLRCQSERRLAQNLTQL
ncbi:hypothetical protein CIHG_03264 [Coccidioides immitis H538.4]|uniref:Uncharacterized protein n=1 Tax=Coccidioides immitis H538.4 TaxID=396776 RepID=A0A0J8RLH5_COCIT|nr:hypothetical protein CIHG_03264 [Coccidioides immitis H538.4]